MLSPHTEIWTKQSHKEEGSTILAAAEPLEITLLYVRVWNSSVIEKHNELGVTGSI